MAESEDNRKTQTTRNSGNRILRKVLEIVGIYAVFWILIFLTTYPVRMLWGFAGEVVYFPRVSFFAFVLLMLIETIMSVIRSINRKSTLSNSEKTLKTILEVSGIYVISWFIVSCYFWITGKLTVFDAPTELTFWRMVFLSFAFTVASVIILNAHRRNHNKDVSNRTKTNK